MKDKKSRALGMYTEELPQRNQNNVIC